MLTRTEHDNIVAVAVEQALDQIDIPGILDRIEALEAAVNLLAATSAKEPESKSVQKRKKVQKRYNSNECVLDGSPSKE